MRITKHAKERIIERNVSTQELVDCIKHGKCYENKWDSNKLTYIHKDHNVYIVTDKAKTMIITVFRKEK